MKEKKDSSYKYLKGLMILVRSQAISDELKSRIDRLEKGHQTSIVPNLKQIICWIDQIDDLGGLREWLENEISIESIPIRQSEEDLGKVVTETWAELKLSLKYKKNESNKRKYHDFVKELNNPKSFEGKIRYQALINVAKLMSLDGWLKNDIDTIDNQGRPVGKLRSAWLDVSNKEDDFKVKAVGEKWGCWQRLGWVRNKSMYDMASSLYSDPRSGRGYLDKQIEDLWEFHNLVFDWLVLDKIEQPQKLDYPAICGGGVWLNDFKTKENMINFGSFGIYTFQPGNHPDKGHGNKESINFKIADALIKTKKIGLKIKELVFVVGRPSISGHIGSINKGLNNAWRKGELKTMIKIIRDKVTQRYYFYVTPPSSLSYLGGPKDKKLMIIGR